MSGPGVAVVTNAEERVGERPWSVADLTGEAPRLLPGVLVALISPPSAWVWVAVYISCWYRISHALTRSSSTYSVGSLFWYNSITSRHTLVRPALAMNMHPRAVAPWWYLVSRMPPMCCAVLYP